MKKKTFITICASVLCIGAYILNSDNLSATKTTDEICSLNANALNVIEDDQLIITCSNETNEDNCQWVCKNCGYEVEKISGYTFLKKSGKCPGCGD